MSKKVKSEQQRREEAEQKAALKRATQLDEQQKREAKAARESEEVYRGMWEQFSNDIEKGKSFAYGRLLKNLTVFARHLVPKYYTAKEHQAAVAEAAELSRGEGKQAAEDPRSLISSWLRGDEDLSRIKLDKAVA